MGVKTRRVLIAPDKFKGTLTAAAAADAIASGWRRACPDDTLTLAPISDGGDGFGAILGRAHAATAREVATVDAAGRTVRATWWLGADGETAVVESANVIGLAMLPRAQFHPFELDTFGLGQVLQAAAAAGAKRCYVGIGGSATNDGGFGMARALGWRFHRRDGGEIVRWTDLTELAEARPPRPLRPFRQLTVAVDVQNKLLGKLGCSRVYGPQKGLREADFAAAESALGRLARVMAKRRGGDLAKEPGAGAAGGLGFGLCAFAGARMRPGFALVSRALKLPQKIRQADLVVTGEGMLDRSTAMGKGTGELAVLCTELGRPCAGLGGQVRDLAALRGRFATCRALSELTTPENAMQDPARWLATLAESVAGGWPR